MPANNKPSHAEQARAIGAYGKLPLGFEANQGQTDSRVRFLSRGGGYSLFLTPNEAVLALKRGQTQKPGRKPNGAKPAIESRKIAAPAVLRMQLVGSNARAGMMGVDELPGKSNYFIGNDPANWRTNVPNYRKVAEHGIYPGIDLIYYGTQRQLEYDFVVAPGSDPHAIRLAFQGADHLSIDSQGNLIASVGGGEVSWQRPVAYQEALDGAKQPVAARFRIKRNRDVSFEVGKHDPARSLIIDPTLAYSTYLGGSSIDGANAIAVAPDDSAFITGETYSSDFPTVNALFPTNAAGSEVAFVSKISPDGSSLLYSTYLGCNPTVGYAIAVDSLGEAYVTGTTMCPTFPTTEGVPQGWCADDHKCGASWNVQGATVFNGFVTKLNVEGTALLYSTFLGDYSMCAGLGIAVDEAQNAYVTGDIGANIEPTVVLTPPAAPPPPFCTYNGFQTSLGGSGGTEYGGIGTDAFIVKIDSAGSEFLYCSYIGGSDEDVGYGIAVDSSANAYVTGVTYSADFPTKGGALQSVYAGAGDAFLTKVSTTTAGSASLLYSTYFGGTGLDQGNGVAVDASGNAYVAGGTSSIDTTLGFYSLIPTGAYQSNCDLDSLGVCEGDAFVAKFALSGTPSLVYFTYLGGTLADSASGVAVDSSGNAYLTGSTVSTDFPIVGAVFQPTYGGGNADAFVTEVNPTGTDLVYSTYLGGSNTDTGNGIAVDTGSPASAYVAGQTCSFDFPLANPLQPTYGGNCDAFISKVSIQEGIALNPAGLVFPTQSLNTPSPPQTVTLTNGDNTQTISSITITGSNAGDFAETSTCPISPATLAPGAQCTITVTFTPTAVGIRKASVEITDSAPGSPHYISLTGSTSSVGLSASSLAFGNQQVGVTSSPQALTVTNNSEAALTISTVNASGAYAQTNNCTTAPLQPTTNCVINVTFTPTAPGPSVGALTIIDSAPGSPQVVLLTGAGVAAPAVSLSTTNLTFSNQVVGTTSAAQLVTLHNVGGSPLNITNVAASGDFAETNTCSASIAPAGSCTISIIFTPTATGTRYGSVTITDNAANSPQTISLVGTGVPAAAVTLLPASLTFGTQTVTTTSAPQLVTVTNTGATVLDITSIAASGDFAQTNTCGATLAVGASCAISVTFSPTAAGPEVGAVTLTDSAPNSPQTVPLTGTGQLAPVVSLVPATLTFTNTSVGTTSSVQTVKLTNTGSAALTISNVAASGDFAQTNNCGASVAAGNYCTISVTFTPTVAGNRYGAVTISDNALNSPQTILLAGSGIATPSVAFLPSSLTFPNQIVNTTSAAQSLTLTNTGGAALAITSITASGDFAQTNACPASLASGASCIISVTFSPTTGGPRSGAISVADNAPGSPQTAALAGVGVVTPVVTLVPTTLTFPGESIGTTSSAMNVTLKNTGTAALSITNMTVSGDFAETNNCGASVAAGASCTISVTFTPTAAGSRYGSVTITDNAADSPQTVLLAGNGLPTPAVAFSPASLAFPNQIVNTTSAPLNVTLSNTGSAVLSIVSITTSGNFAQTNTCGTSLANGTSCTISVTFTPTAGGPRAGTIIVTDNAAGSPQTVPLTGSGLLAPVVTLLPKSLTFTGQAVGSTSAPQTVTLTNSGSATLYISSVTASGDFAQTNTCGASVAVGANCVISVTFTPTAAGNRYGSVTITDNAADSPETVLLAGNGSSAPAVAFLPSSLTFPNQIVNTASAPQNVILTNSGGATLTITSIIASGNFSETNSCGASLASGASCTIAVTFTPSASGPLAGAVTVTDNAPGSPQTLPLNGTGVLASVVVLSPTNLTFSSQPVGTTSAAQLVTLANVGRTVLEFTSVTTTGDFGQTNGCPASLPAGASCVISVTFAPTAIGNRYGSVVITDNAPDSPQIIPLAGSGVPSAVVTFSPTSLSFPSQITNTTSAPQLVTLANTGTAAMSITSIVSTTSEFSELNTCGASLAPGASCTISVTFTPAASGPRAGAITVTDNAPGSPQTVPLTGSGLQGPVVTLAPKSLTFAGQAVGSTSTPQTVTLANIGSAALNITSVTATGDFAQTNTCGASVAVGIACTITVTFTPTVPGNRYGSVTITDNAADSPQTIVLAGDGLPAPVVSLSVTSLTFSSQPLGTTSAPQAVTMSNTGTAALTITGIVTTGDFAQIDTCGTSLPVGASCTINITFTPTAAGSRTGSLIITDNAPGSPQVVNLGGSGADFAVSVTPTSASVIAGNSVAYTFTVTPSFGFNAKVTLGCSGAPRGASCSMSPLAVTPDGTNPVTATFTVTTTVRSMLPPRSGPNLNLPRLVTRVRPTWFLWLLLLLTLLASRAMARRRRALLRLALVTGLVLLWVACGAGGSQVDVSDGTPAGNYTLTLSGTSGNVTHYTTANLTVE
jgi:hypothetical protein